MLKNLTRESAARVAAAVEDLEPRVEAVEVGTVLSVGRGIARVDGLPHVGAEELVRFNTTRGGGVGTLGFTFNIAPGELGLIVLGDPATLSAGMTVRRCGRVMDLPVGDALLGRVIDATGRPLDGHRRPALRERQPIEVVAPAIMDRAPVTTPLQTGIKAVDALIPIGRGQRELILGDRQTGKSAVALDIIVNQRDQNVACVYCAVGQRKAAVAAVINSLREYGALDYTLVVVASCDDAPGLQFIAPYAATAAAEFFMRRGRDVLVVYDDLTKHARAYRELSLLLRRPPGREAYPGDIFYVHSRLLERATHLRDKEGGGSLTALPIIETEAQNISAYIPTNLISITDGQVYLSPELFRKGQLPAIDIGKSVSRVGGKAQLKAYREVASDLRLSYSQFEELERFSRFGTRLDEDTRRTLRHGRRVRAILRQSQFHPLPVPEQISVLLAVAEGVLDEVPLEQVAQIEAALVRRLRRDHGETCNRIMAGNPLADEDRRALLALARDIVKEKTDADSGSHEAPD